MSLLPKLLQDARGVSADDFIQLIKTVTERLGYEKKNCKFENFTVRGSLINFMAINRLAVVGDIHGDIESLAYIIQDFFPQGANSRDLILFLGDYGDRGRYSPEVYYIVLWLKTSFPDNIVILRGNHEGPPDLTPYPFDLPIHLQRKFGAQWKRVYSFFPEFFSKLHLAAFLKGKYLFLHGGIPSEAVSLEDLAYADQQHPAKSFLEEILWSDPQDGFEGTYPSPRGAGKLFGEDVTRKFLERIDVRILVRGHEPCEEGFNVSHQGKVFTLFSRKGAPYNNSCGAYLKLEGEAPLDHNQLPRKIVNF